MIGRKAGILLAAGVMLACGCASNRAVQPQASAAPATAPATTRPLDPKAVLALSQIEPRPVLPPPSTQPEKPPSLEAIEAFARARDLQLQHQPYNAINLYEKALTLDPDSFEVNCSLGRLYLGMRGMSDRGVTALERAERIKPNDLALQIDLGRAYQSRSDADKAIEHFRLAMLTDDYGEYDNMLASVVDYRLGVALEQKGYDRAALDCYESLVKRLEHPSGSPRLAPEVASLLARPESLFDEMGKLYEKLGDLPEALLSYRLVAERSPNDFDLQARVVGTLVKLRAQKDATAAAAEVVRQFHASPESIALLRSVYRDFGSERAFVDVLQRLYREHPGDRSVLFALADTLASSGKLADAQALLFDAIESHDGDAEIVERLWQLYADRDQVIDAAKLLIRLSAEHPDITSEIDPLFLDLVRPSRKSSLRAVTVQKLDVPADQQSARQYWLWRVWAPTRPAAARAALDQSAHAPRPFDPACRALLESYVSRSDWDDAAKDRAAAALIESVRSRGGADLAAELDGIVALRHDRFDQAVNSFAEAIRLNPRPSPDLQLQYAFSIFRQGNPARFEQLMWKLLSDRPRYGPGYLLLLSYFKQNDEQRAWDLVGRWVTADPNSVSARIQQCLAQVQQRRVDEALVGIRKLFEQHPDDAQVVTTLQVLLSAAGQGPQAIELLEAERAAHPGNRIAIESLVEIYSTQNRPADATRVLDAARAAVADDPDLLYYVAHLYERIDQKQVTEQILEQVLKLDPTHAPAGNDLGYTWADAGKNLERAEAMIRSAVDAEPDNPSYLDSLGWVLYKRGHFEDALKLLTLASEPGDGADPVVLDHLGDALYRLNRTDQARQTWQRSWDRIDAVPERDELRDLRNNLRTKLAQARAGQPVDVAPVVESKAQNKTQAQN